MEDDDPHQPHDLQGQGSRSQGHVISLSRVGPVAQKSKTNSHSITKISTRMTDNRGDLQGQRSGSQGYVINMSCVGSVPYKSKNNNNNNTELVQCRSIWPNLRRGIVVVSPKLAWGYPMTCATLHTSFKIKRSKVWVTGWLMQTPKMCYSFRMLRPKNFKVGVLMEDIDPHQWQVPWSPRLKVKVLRPHGMSDLCGPYCKICTWHSDTLRSPKQQIWRRTALCGGWCQCMALRNLRVPCQKRRWWLWQSTKTHMTDNCSDLQGHILTSSLSLIIQETKCVISLGGRGKNWRLQLCFF